MRQRGHGFTLVELLVVVTIITLFIAILLPSLKRTRDAAQVVACASNERQIAVGAFSYAADNTGLLMVTVQTQSQRDPVCIGTAKNPTTGEWNVYRIQPYLNGFDMNTHRPTGVFLCPGVNADFYAWFTNFQWDRSTWDKPHHITQLTYAYFAGVDRWTAQARNGADRQLCQSRPGGADRVLVSDPLFPDANYATYFRYNHGVTGWSFNYPPVPSQYEQETGRSAGCVYQLAPPAITGLNQAFGDGSVRWKDASRINTDKMYNVAAYPDGWVYRPGGAPGYY